MRSPPRSITGSTASVDFPVSADAFQPALAGGSRADAFLTVYRNGQRPFSTYFGGTGADAGGQLAVDSAGALVMIGSTESRDFPTSVGPMTLWKRSLGFVARFPQIGARPQIASYLVGTADELAVGPDNAIYVGGVAASRWKAQLNLSAKAPAFISLPSRPSVRSARRAGASPSV